MSDPDREPPTSTDAAEKNIAPEAGKRASVDRDGEVHGSGSGAGGGNPGENYDEDSQAE